MKWSASWSIRCTRSASATSCPSTRSASGKLVEDMINGGLERLDPHSTYIDPEEYKQFSKTEQGQVRRHRHPGRRRPQKRGQLTVISPMPGTPAYKAGVLAGDVILKIDGKSTDSMRLNEAVDMIQGDPARRSR